MRDFIIQALYDRYNAVKDNWGCQIHEKMIDELVEMIADAWVWEWVTAWTIIDNRLVNWEHWTYNDWWCYHMNRDENEYWEDKFEEIEEDLNNNCMFYDRDLEEYCSY